MKKDSFLTHESIYIWNLLLKSFPMIRHMVPKVDCNESDILIFFGKIKFDLVISSEPKQKKTRKKKDFKPTLKKKSSNVCNLKSKKMFIILIQKWVYLWMKTYMIIADHIKQHMCCNCIKSTSILLILSVECCNNLVT